jgi:hypothetical protein
LAAVEVVVVVVRRRAGLVGRGKGFEEREQALVEQQRVRVRVVEKASWTPLMEVVHRLIPFHRFSLISPHPVFASNRSEMKNYVNKESRNNNNKERNKTLKEIYYFGIFDQTDCWNAHFHNSGFDVAFRVRNWCELMLYSSQANRKKERREEVNQRLFILCLSRRIITEESFGAREQLRRNFDCRFRLNHFLLRRKRRIVLRQ